MTANVTYMAQVIYTGRLFTLNYIPTKYRLIDYYDRIHVMYMTQVHQIWKLLLTSFHNYIPTKYRPIDYYDRINVMYMTQVKYTGYVFPEQTDEKYIMQPVYETAQHIFTSLQNLKKITIMME